LFQKRVNTLGHNISAEGIEADPGKLSAIKDWPVPSTVHEGFFGYVLLKTFPNYPNPFTIFFNVRKTQ